MWRLSASVLVWNNLLRVLKSFSLSFFFKDDVDLDCTHSFKSMISMIWQKGGVSVIYKYCLQAMTQIYERPKGILSYRKI